MAFIIISGGKTYVQNILPTAMSLVDQFDDLFLPSISVWLFNLYSLPYVNVTLVTDRVVIFHAYNVMV